MISVQFNHCTRSRLLQPLFTSVSRSRSFHHSPPRMSLSSYLVMPAQLNTALTHDKTIVPLSAAWFLPNDPQKRTGASSFRALRIPKSRFFDLDGCKDEASPYPHMLPSAEQFASYMGALGISQTDTVVVYDTQELGIFSAPRVAWHLAIMGHPNVHLLNNFRLWVDQGFPTETGEPATAHAKEYKVPAAATPKEVVSFDEMKIFVNAARTNDAHAPTVLDARPEGRWQGSAPEPRPGLPSGHMPGSISLPFTDVLDPQTKAFLSAERLREVLEAKKIPKSGAIVSSCGTGVTAAVIDTVLAEAGYVAQDQRRVYDGSWTEWASRVSPEDGWIEQTKT